MNKNKILFLFGFLIVFLSSSYVYAPYCAGTYQAPCSQLGQELCDGMAGCRWGPYCSAGGGGGPAVKALDVYTSNTFPKGTEFGSNFVNSDFYGNVRYAQQDFLISQDPIDCCTGTYSVSCQGYSESNCKSLTGCVWNTGCRSGLDCNAPTTDCQGIGGGCAGSYYTKRHWYADVPYDWTAGQMYGLIGYTSEGVPMMTTQSWCNTCDDHNNYGYIVENGRWIQKRCCKAALCVGGVWWCDPVDVGSANHYNSCTTVPYGSCGTVAPYTSCHTTVTDGYCTCPVGANETCNGLDDNCAGGVDEGVGPTTRSCSNSNGFGTCSGSQSRTCNGFAGWSAWGACSAATPAAEVCDGVDNNCAGGVDEGVGPTTQSCSNVNGFGTCTGTQSRSCNGDAGWSAWSGCSAATPAAEVCDGIDNNCAGGVDEGVGPTTQTCTNTNVYGTCSGSQSRTCNGVAGWGAWSGCSAATPAAEVCDGVDNNCAGGVDEGVGPTTQSCSNTNGFGTCTGTQTRTCNGVAGWSAWNVCSAATPAAEICDGVDNNCAGGVDEGVGPTTQSCSNTNVYGTCTGSQSRTCNGVAGWGAWNVCSAATPAAESCNNIDDDCDGTTDEGCDDDNDNYCDSTMTLTSSSTCTAGGNDCRDDLASINPGIAEVCDLVDNNCNAQIDDGVRTTYYRDADADGYGNPGVTASNCSVPLGFVASNADCNDANAAIHPGVDEKCDDVDDDCDGAVDNGCDVDNDNYCNATKTLGASHTTCVSGADCNDLVPSTYPGAPELCNSVDDNCVGGIDENIWYNQSCYIQNGEGVRTTTCNGAAGWGAPYGYCDVVSCMVNYVPNYIPNANDTCTIDSESCTDMITYADKINFPPEESPTSFFVVNTTDTISYICSEDQTTGVVRSMSFDVYEKPTPTSGFVEVKPLTYFENPTVSAFFYGTDLTTHVYNTYTKTYPICAEGVYAMQYCLNLGFTSGFATQMGPIADFSQQGISQCAKWDGSEWVVATNSYYYAKNISCQNKVPEVQEYTTATKVLVLPLANTSTVIAKDCSKDGICMDDFSPDFCGFNVTTNLHNDPDCGNHTWMKRGGVATSLRDNVTHQLITAYPFEEPRRINHKECANETDCVYNTTSGIVCLKNNTVLDTGIPSPYDPMHNNINITCSNSQIWCPQGYALVDGSCQLVYGETCFKTDCPQVSNFTVYQDGILVNRTYFVPDYISNAENIAGAGTTFNDDYYRVYRDLFFSNNKCYQTDAQNKIKTVCTVMLTFPELKYEYQDVIVK